MKRLFAAGLFLALLGGTALHAQTRPEDSITPGLWQYKTRFMGVVVDDEKKCVTGVEIDKFFTGPCNRHHTCVYPVRQVGNGRARFEGYWQNKEGKRTNVTAEGTYSPRQFTLNARALGLRATVEARWVAPTCPAATPARK